MTDDELKNFETDFWEATKLPTTIKESAICYQSAEDMLKRGQAVTNGDVVICGMTNMKLIRESVGLDKVINLIERI